MADRYVRSTDGNNTDSGATWELAKADLAGVATIDTAGDRIFVSQSHNETTAGSITLNLAGTISNPVQVVCANDSAEPPTSVATGATVTTTGTSNISINGHAYIYGMNFICGDGIGSSSIDLGINGDGQIYEKCSFQIAGSGVSGRVRVTSSISTTPVKMTWLDCSLKFGSTSQRVTFWNSVFHWNGGSILAGGSSPIALLGFNTRFSKLFIENVDLSNLNSTSDVVANGSTDAHVVLRNCKMPAGWTGTPISGTAAATFRIEMYNCDAADTNYRIWIKDSAGELTQETTIVRTGGASDGTTSLSWKIVTTANCNFLSGRFQSPEIARWNETISNPITVTVEILHDSLTALNDDEIWLEVNYLGTSGYPLALLKSDSKTDVLASAAAQDSSSATWTTTGMTNPNKQLLSVTFTPQKKGYIHAKVCMGKASYTVYVDPKLAVA